MYTEEIASEICLRLSGGESLRAICEDERLPNRTTVHLWVISDREGFSNQYARARQSQALRWAEEIMDIADTDGDVQRSRLQVDTRKWMLSKVLPKVYGEKQQVEHSGVDGAPIITEITRRIIHVKKP